MQLNSQSKNTLVQLIFIRAVQAGYKSQKDLAKAAGVSESVISRLSKGRLASADNLYALLNTLDLLKHQEDNSIPAKSASTPAELLYAYKELSAAHKDLADHKDRIRELEHALAELQLRYRNDRRRDDPPDVIPSKLRRPIHHSI